VSILSGISTTFRFQKPDFKTTILIRKPAELLQRGMSIEPVRTIKGEKRLLEDDS
jgi:hypothetical protein